MARATDPAVCVYHPDNNGFLMPLERFAPDPPPSPAETQRGRNNVDRDGLQRAHIQNRSGIRER